LHRPFLVELIECCHHFDVTHNSVSSHIPLSGKGQLQTYWLEAYVGSSSRSAGSSSAHEDSELAIQKSATSTSSLHKMMGQGDKHERLVDWNVDIIKKVLVQVVKRRSERGVKSTPEFELRQLELQVQQESILGAVKDIVSLPKFTRGKGKLTAEVELSVQAEIQLRVYIVSLAKMYRLNPFHNFEVCLNF
jgi:hypothetical protein